MFTSVSIPLLCKEVLLLKKITYCANPAFHTSALHPFLPLHDEHSTKFIQNCKMSKLNDKKGPSEEVPPPTEPSGLENGETAHRIREDDTILGITRESSGWDVYNNEARKVDMELVKDWTASLNFLLLFVSPLSQ